MVHTKTSHHDRMEVFLEKYREPLPKPLEELERKALSEDVPIIRSGTRDVLRFLLRERKPKEVLEIGTAVGFSALCMREYLPKSSHITTIEKVEMRLKEARKNLERMYEDNRITLLEGDAAEVLICCTRSTFEANVATIIRFCTFSSKIESKVAPTVRSDSVKPGFKTFVLSHINARTPFFPISANLCKSIASPNTGV